MIPSPPKRSRRSTEEIRGLLIDAARELFLSRGYDATTTKDIAERAGVAEKLLFGNYATKDGIFDAAVVAPFSGPVDRYVAAWADDNPDASIEDRIGAFVNDLFELASHNRVLLRAALARRDSNDRDARGDILDHLATTLQDITRVETDQLPGVDNEAALDVVAGMIFGVALLDDMLFPIGRRRPSRSRLTSEMTALILRGVLNRDPPSIRT